MEVAAQSLQPENTHTEIVLSDEFLSKYPEGFPEHMTLIGKFTALRTYSRYLTKEQRRETWKETCIRAIQYSASLVLKFMEKVGIEITDAVRESLTLEAEELFDNMYNLRQALSGRTCWVGGADTGVANKFPLANFNCSFTLMQSLARDMGDLFYLLLVGTGVGFRAPKAIISQLPPIRQNVQITHREYVGVPKQFRRDDTEVSFRDSVARITVGDSKEGWVEAMRSFFNLLTDEQHAHIDTIEIDYNNIRPKGARLVTFGGTASGYEPLQEMFEGFGKVLRNEIDPDLDPLEVVSVDERGNVWVKVRPIHILDMGNLTGYNVVVGGVRRTAELFGMDEDDYESMLAKYGINGIWGEEGFERHEKLRQMMVDLGIPVPKWWDKLAVRHYDVLVGEEKHTFTNVHEAIAFAGESNVPDYTPLPYNEGRKLHHRRMSNNSIFFIKKPSKEFLDFVFTLMQGEGEPGFINIYEVARRRLAARGITDEDAILAEALYLGINPCAEILLKFFGVCNLTTVNVKAFVVYRADGTAYLDMAALKRSQRLSARAGVRMTLVEMELPHWDARQQEDRLIGTSLTGWYDAMDAIDATPEDEERILAELREVTRTESRALCDQLGINYPLLDTTIKPEGTQSIVFGAVSPGIHRSKGRAYFRRIRINAADPLAKAVLEHKGWIVDPEYDTPGETREEKMKNARTLVVTFPVKSSAKKTLAETTVEEQFQTYFMFQRVYTAHNTSNTISLYPHEWTKASEIIHENWADFVGVSFLAQDGGTYELAPYEVVSEAECDALAAQMQPFDMSTLQKYEVGDDVELELDESCADGACAPR